MTISSRAICSPPSRATVREYSASHPEADIIRLGIGDVTRPLVPAVIDALHAAVEDQAKQETFHGYGDEQGYDFLHEALVGYYKTHGVELATNEIFISDGAKSDLGNILDIFGKDNVVLVLDPVYPVYVDTNVMAGRKIIFADANEANGFLPLPDASVKCDIIYICSPNNPTGAAYDRAGLKAWVDYANAQNAVILYDAAYECFIEDENLPRSIYEIEGAKTCAIEFCSFSKMAGFTGTRCGCTRRSDRARGRQTEQDVAAPPDHQVQRRSVYRTEGRRRLLHRGRHEADQGYPRLLQAECQGPVRDAR